jgi:hypothetical protein
MAGRWVCDGDARCFVPRFGFAEGTPYRVTVEGARDAILVRSRADRPATTEVTSIHPTTTVVPRNLLRLYVTFSAPMSEGYAADHIRLVDGAGDALVAALLANDQELWDPTRRRLTVLLDPARIKRGLVPHRQAGYPLRTGTSVQVLVDDGFRDASGTRLRAGAQRGYQVGPDQRHPVDPNRWTLTLPCPGTFDPLDVAFDRPLDHALAARCLHVVGPRDQPVDGTVEVGSQERSWRLVPTEPWSDQPHHLIVDPVLEDLAGNSVARPFDRDLTDIDDRPGESRPTKVMFCPG